MEKSVEDIENSIVLFYEELAKLNELNKTDKPLREYVRVHANFEKSRHIVRLCFMAELTDYRLKAACEALFTHLFPYPVGTPVLFDLSCEDQSLA